jgi:PPM family protein phosphatase
MQNAPPGAFCISGIHPPITERFQSPRLMNQFLRHASTSGMLRPSTRRIPMIEFGHGTHVGLRRTRNEDTYYADAALGLFLVADGMGGHQHGEVASALARDAVVEHVRGGQSLVEAVRGAAARVLEHAQRYDDALPMGSTIAAIHVSEQGYDIAWVGDSRIYQWNNGLKQVSHDHSLVQRLVTAGVLDESQASRHPYRNVLTQALGITALDQLHISVAKGQLAPDMGFLVCSDGLTEEVSDAAIADIVRRQELAAQECVDHLLLAALDRGGSDNVTAILARVR